MEWMLTVSVMRVKVGWGGGDVSNSGAYLSEDGQLQRSKNRRETEECFKLLDEFKLSV